MKLKQSTIMELKKILEEEYSLILEGEQLEKMAYSLINYFGLLYKIQNRGESSEIVRL